MKYVTYGKTESGQDLVGCGHRHPMVRHVQGGDGASPLVISGHTFVVGAFVFEISNKTIVCYCGETCYRLHKQSMDSTVALALMEGDLKQKLS